TSNKDVETGGQEDINADAELVLVETGGDELVRFCFLGVEQSVALCFLGKTGSILTMSAHETCLFNSHQRLCLQFFLSTCLSTQDLNILNLELLFILGLGIIEKVIGRALILQEVLLALLSSLDEIY
ncbi:hypothetical protein ACJX0J_010801, partial [Zea mays]